MIQLQPVKNVHIDYIDVDTKHRLLAVKPARVKVLAESLKEVGRIMNPIFVIRKGGPDAYQLVAGATRLAAAKQLGWGEVPIILISGTDDEIKQVEIEENLGRLDLSKDEREHLEHARKMCRGNIDKAVAELKAYEAAHPKEVAKAYAEADEIGKAAGKALAQRETKPSAAGVRPKRKHRKTGGKKGRPAGEGARAIARKHGVPRTTLRRKTGAISARGPKKPLLATSSAPSDACGYDWRNVKEIDFGNPSEAYRRQSEHYRREAVQLAEAYPLLAPNIDIDVITEDEIQAVRDVAQAWFDLAKTLVQRTRGETRPSDESVTRHQSAK